MVGRALCEGAPSYLPDVRRTNCGSKPSPTVEQCSSGYLWVPIHSSAVRHTQIPRKYADITDHNPNVHGLVLG